MISAAELRTFARHLPTGVAIMTTRDGAGALYGLTMNAVTCLSLEPPLFLVCLAAGAGSLRALEESGVFALNVMAADQAGLCEVFASKRRDKFAACAYALGRLGVPLLQGAVASIECRVATRFPGGDHHICLGAVEHAVVNGGAPLMFFQGRWARVDGAAPAG